MTGVGYLRPLIHVLEMQAVTTSKCCRALNLELELPEGSDWPGLSTFAKMVMEYSSSELFDCQQLEVMDGS